MPDDDSNQVWLSLVGIRPWTSSGKEDENVTNYYKKVKIYVCILKLGTTEYGIAFCTHL